MKTETKIRQHLKQLEFRVRKERLAKNFKRKPETCKFNVLPYIPEGEPDDVNLYRVCSNQQRQGCVCDESFGGDLLARECPLWTPRATEEEVKEEFKRFMTESPLSTIAMEAPVVAALRWVLDSDVSLDEETEGLPKPETVEIQELSFWAKLRKLFG